jgi:hypothetical protein
MWSSPFQKTQLALVELLLTTWTMVNSWPSQAMLGGHEIRQAKSISHMRKTNSTLRRHGDLISNVRESMVSLERMLLFLSANMSRPKRASGFEAEWRTAVRDVQSIEEHASFLSSKMQFVLDATLGLVSLGACSKCVVPTFGAAACADKSVQQQL